MTDSLRASDFDFDLPPERIATEPARPRDAARMLHVAERLADCIVRDLPGLLRPGDHLIANDTRVIPAQLTARRAGPAGAKIGITLDRPLPSGAWHALARNARRLRPNDPLSIDNSTTLTATVESIVDGGSIALRFNLEG